MANPYEQPSAKKDDPIGDMAYDFDEFIHRQNFTTDQVREAYYQLMGASEKTDTDPGITTILTEMERLEKEHFPVNRFAEFIGTKQKIEDAIPVYKQFVESLPVSNKEKSMLHSIVEKKRSGVLEITIGGVLSAEIQIRGIDDDPELMATEILHVLKKVMAHTKSGQSVEFTFNS